MRIVIAGGHGQIALRLERLLHVARHVEGADAAVFAAGAGPGSGESRKDTVDRAACALFADAAEAAGVRRFIVVSAMGADREPPEGTDPVFAAYLRAKGAADADVRTRTGLDPTILRPGQLTGDPGVGTVSLTAFTGRGAVPRDDVAAVIAALLHEPRTAGQTLELISGDVPVDDAVANLAS
jgi:uncharacterized protein YbjT (DUF2867 family)